MADLKNPTRPQQAEAGRDLGGGVFAQPAAYVAGLDDRLLFSSAAYRRLAEVMGWRADGGRPPWLAQVREALLGGEPQVRREDVASAGRRAAGAVASEHVLLCDGDGRPAAVQARFRAVGGSSELLRLRARRAEARLADVIRLTLELIWETDAELRFTYVSPRVSDVLGVAPPQLHGVDLGALGDFGAADAADAADKGRAALAAQRDPARREPFRDLEVAVKRPDGRVAWLRLSGVPTFDDKSGAFQGYRGAARDITAEREARADAEVSRTRLVAAIASINEGFALVGADGRLALTNAIFDDMFGASPPGADYRELVAECLRNGRIRADAEGQARDLRRRLGGGGRDRAPFELELADGRWVLGVDARTADGDMVAVRTDITDLKEREAALVQAKRLAEAANRAKSAFLATMSHELRTPLNAIMGFTEIMRDGVMGEIEVPQYRSYLRDIHDSASHLRRVINACLDVARIESGAMELDERLVDLGRVCRRVQGLVEARARAKDLEVGFDCPHDLPHVVGDEHKLQQALYNLVENAVKFSRESGRVACVVRRGDHAGIDIKVVDVGIGMDANDIPRALDPFRQLDSGLERRFGGLGIGLPLARGIIERHGGTIAIDSKLGHGTSVTVTLPAERTRAR